ncbi:MAG: spermidine/putrescine ABC transporter substrate-binding protein, partial [Oscillospiraceae bacterium]
TNEELYAKLKAGGSSYDVITPSEYMIAKMAGENMLLPLDKEKIPNFKYIDKNLLDMDYDKGNTYSIPYTWGTVVIIYNKDLVSPDTDVNTWNLLWNEKYKDNILMFNNPRDAYGIALKKLNKPINPTNQGDIDAATKELKAQKPMVQAYVMDEIFDKMSAGEAAIAPYYAGDAITMISDNPSLAAVFPREGTNIFVDALCIPKDAQQKEAAEMYINFMAEPKVAAANAEVIGYSTPISEAKQYLSTEMRESPIAYPSEEIIKNAEYFVLLPQDMNLALDNGWKDLLTEDAGFTFWLVPAALAIVLIASIVMVVKRNKKKKEDY